MSNIPNEFILLLPNIVEIVHSNKEKLCKKNEVIAIFGMQVSFMSITSDIPRITNRVINSNNPNCHLCCNLNYLVTDAQKQNKATSWEGAKTIMIDFTTGVVMDKIEYLKQIVNKNESCGRVYGYLDRIKLANIWKVVTCENHFESKVNDWRPLNRIANKQRISP